MGFQYMNKKWTILCLLLAFAMTEPAQADGLDSLERLVNTDGSASKNASPAEQAGDTGILRLTPDKTHILRLDQDAASVIVANPEHANVMLDSPRLLIIMPRQPGTTSFTVLNARGENILEKTVIISAVQQDKKYVRIRRMCAGGDTTCIPSAYYYCPDGCYEVTAVASDGGATQVPEIAAGTPPALPSDTPAASDERLEEETSAESVPAETEQEAEGQ